MDNLFVNKICGSFHLIRFCLILVVLVITINAEIVLPKIQSTIVLKGLTVLVSFVKVFLSTQKS